MQIHAMKSFFSSSKTVFGRKIPYRRKGNSSCKINLLCKITMNYMYIYCRVPLAWNVKTM